jgi:hypothetical protein
LCAWADLGFGPEAIFRLKIPFLFFYSVQLISNIKNLYLNLQSSKNYEISSIGFIIF